ncbi:hypothetical protein E4T50_14377 [Aureobasidium sp. EXF-12298]|nr:hypothetical protein E4T50_14377 [Aureobasidium sp. EXF-12298]KAI4770052.1 hypothetical protein E4T52_14926 [Aureobasidium sp. EXF-3400]
MRRLSRAFSRAKETDKEQEAKTTTISPTNSPSPPPPTYEEAERQQHNVQHPPDAANSFAQLDPDLPSPEDGIAHLKLLECFYRLKQKIASTDGLFDISSDILGKTSQNTPPQKDAQDDKKNMMLTLLAEKRWQVYVSRAVDRFAKWRYSLESDADYYTLHQAVTSEGDILADRVKPEKADPFPFDAANLPSIDVLMVWHSYMLNPRAYLEDCARQGRMRLWHTPFPLQVVANHISDPDYHYETAKQTMTSFREQTGLAWDNLDSLDETSVDCHSCYAQNTAPWTTFGDLFEEAEEFPRWAAQNKAIDLKAVESRISACQGFADKEFTLTCQKCNSKITHDSLCVGKLRKDLKLLLEQGVVLPGNILENLGCRLELMNIAMGQRIIELRGADIQMASVREVVEHYLTIEELVKEAKHDKRNPRLHAKEAIALRRMMSRYWDNCSVFAIDLVGAVIRQGSFIDKMHDIDWLHSPALSHTIPRLMHKYSRFIAIISKYNKMAVPTLDVDLAWHTHQLNPSRYLQYTVAKSKTFIDHDDKVAETKLTDAFAETSKIYQRLYGEPYSECTCWYCEAVRESHTSTASRLFRSNNATAADKLHSVPSDPGKSVHISTHNAVRPTGDKSYDENVNKRIGELEKAYEKACKRADKKGKPCPKRDDYYYSESYGHADPGRRVIAAQALAVQQRLQVDFVRVLDLVGLWEGVLQEESAVAAVAHSAEAVVEEEEEAQDVEGAAVVAVVEEEVVVDARWSFKLSHALDVSIRMH